MNMQHSVGFAQLYNLVSIRDTYWLFFLSKEHGTDEKRAEVSNNIQELKVNKLSVYVCYQLT